MREFDFIQTCLAPIAGDGAEALADDCAWLGSDGNWLAISTDTSVEGVHFPKGMRGASATERAARTALSDLAAKAADPIGMFVNLTLPHDLDPRCLQGLALGLAEVRDLFGATLLGGDTTRSDGPLTISVTVLGRAERKLLRSGARPGQGVYLSGPIGDSALGLRYLRGEPAYQNPSGADLAYWEEAYLRPEPEFRLRDTLRACATSSIDISDGLLADARHIAQASGVRLELVAWDVPLSPQSRRYVGDDEGHLVDLLTAGDDYRIVFTSAHDIADATRIGTVSEGEGLALLGKDGHPIPVIREGWEH